MITTLRQIKLDIDAMCQLDERRHFMRPWMRQHTIGEFRKLDEESDAHAITVRMLALWEADEAMRDGVGDRDHPTDFLAWVAERRETARLTMYPCVFIEQLPCGVFDNTSETPAGHIPP
jgi:hypothetical protein